MKFNQSNVEAVQWNKPGDDARVKESPKILHVRGDAYYVDSLYPFATCWLSLTKYTSIPEWANKGLLTAQAHGFQLPLPSQDPYYRLAWLFAIFNVKGEKSDITFDPDNPLHVEMWEDYELVMTHQFGAPRKPHGMLLHPAVDNRLVVFPGDWLVSSGSGILIVSDDDFQKQYKPQEEQP